MTFARGHLRLSAYTDPTPYADPVRAAGRRDCLLILVSQQKAA